MNDLAIFNDSYFESDFDIGVATESIGDAIGDFLLQLELR